MPVQEARLAQPAEQQPGATGDELGLLSMLIKGKGDGAADDFELNLFEEDEPMGGAKRGSTKKAVAKKEGGKAAPVAKRASLSKAMKEVGKGKYISLRLVMFIPDESG